MQTSELDQTNNIDTGDVESINFRPSPNFKHMRKYLKAHSSPNQSSDHSTSPPNEEQEQVNRESETARASTSSMAQPGQPPLPPNSPPPDLVVPKQEVEDEEYDRRTLRPEPKLEAREVKTEKPPEKTMCRQFARGTCTRGSSCIYVHELILSQLPGVYTFCKNFQNSICKFPMCKFVHATVFEKEHFYRTGYLPPLSLAHLRESNSALAPPLEPSTPAEAPPAQSMQFMNPPPTMLPGVSSLPMSGTSPPNVLPLSEMHGPSPSYKSRHEFESGGNPDKCKNCDNAASRLMINQQVYKEHMEQLESLRQRNTTVDRQLARLNRVAAYLLKNKFLNPASSRKDIDSILPTFFGRR